MEKNRRRRQKRRKKVDTNEPTRHHIRPSSLGGSNKKHNIAMVIDKKHKAYHTMFSNMLPSEIIHELVDNYWNGQWEHVARAIERLELIKEKTKRLGDVRTIHERPYSKWDSI